MLAGWDLGGLQGAQGGGSSYTLTSDLLYHPNKKLGILNHVLTLSLNMLSSSCLADSKQSPGISVSLGSLLAIGQIRDF